MSNKQIWVDADACPVVIKEVLVKASKRTQTLITFVANAPLQLPKFPTVKFIKTTKDFDAADDFIEEQANNGDLAITQDIPLASALVDKGVYVISPRGQLLNKDNIKSLLNMRDFMETLRASGVQTGGPSQLGLKDRQQFANQLDRWLAKNSPQTRT